MACGKSEFRELTFWSFSAVLFSETRADQGDFVLRLGRAIKGDPFLQISSGRVFTGVVRKMKMQRTIIIRRDYLHFVKKYGRFERRHTVSPARFYGLLNFRSEHGCPPLSLLPGRWARRYCDRWRVPTSLQDCPIQRRQAHQAPRSCQEAIRQVLSALWINLLLKKYYILGYQFFLHLTKVFYKVKHL